MKAPQRLVDICWFMYENNKELAHGNDGQRRKLTMMIAQQAHNDLSTESFQFGTKSSTPGNPPSKDSIAVKAKSGILYGWDWQHGVSRKPQITSASEAEIITGQNFIEVLAVDYMGGEHPPIPEPEPEPTNPPNICESKFGPELGRELGAILTASPAYSASLEGTGEFIAYLLYHVQFQGMTHQEAKEEAMIRAGQ